VVDQDEYIRAGTTVEALGKLQARLLEGRHGHRRQCLGINDGAAALVLMTEAEAQKRGLTPLARIASWATAGVDPAIMGTGPIPSSAQGAGEGRLEGADLELVEANEAFAAQALAVNKDMGWDPSIVNVNGGAIAIGHPDRRVGRPRARDPSARDGPPQRQEGPGHALHRRRHGRCHVP
jgi:acetyl-CoA C-acetyltransferase